MHLPERVRHVRTPSVDGTLVGAFIVALVATHVAPAGVLDTVAVVGVAAVFVAVFAVRNATLPLPVYGTIGFAGLAGLLIAQIAAGRFATVSFALDLLAAVAVIAVALFVLPRVVSVGQFVRIAALVAAALLIVRIVALVSTSPFGVKGTVPGLIGVVGCIGMVELFDRDRRPLDLALALLAGLFVVSTAERGAIAAFVVGLAVYALDTRGSRRLATAAVAVGAVALVGFVAGVIAAPRAWVVDFPIPLTRRQWLWRGTWAAITETPTIFILGVGYVSAKNYIRPFVDHWMAAPHGPHSGYLLMWFRAGVGAAALQIALVWGTIAVALRRNGSPAVVACAVALAVDMAVANYALVMVSLRAVLLAALLGYALRDCVNRWWTLDIGTATADGLSARRTD